MKISVEVIYPPCNIIDPEWFENGVHSASGESYRIQIDPANQDEEYFCQLRGTHGDWKRHFQFKQVEKEPAKDEKMVEILAGIGIAVFLVVAISIGGVAMKKCKTGKPAGLQNFSPEHLPMLRSEENPLQVIQMISHKNIEAENRLQKFLR